MEDLLRSKGLYQITIGLDPTPLVIEKRAKWLNVDDEARGIIGMFISEDLKFHIQSLDTLQDAWLELEQLFGKTRWLGSGGSILFKACLELVITWIRTSRSTQ